MSDTQTSFDKKLDEIQDKLINDVLDYVGRMQKVGSPILFLGDYKAESVTAIKQLILSDAIRALYAPKPDETVESILDEFLGEYHLHRCSCYPTGCINCRNTGYNQTPCLMCDKDGHPFERKRIFISSITAHYAAKEQEAVLRATANSKKLITELISLYGIPICENLHHPKKYQHGPFQKCPVEVRLAIITNQLNKMKGKQLKREQGVFYDEKTAEQFPKCCDMCSDVTFEKTYPEHTAYYACTNIECECHQLKGEK